MFAALGALGTVFASRLPTVRDLLDFSPVQMGFLLLVGSLGSVAALPVSGAIIMRFGLQRVLRVTVVLQTMFMTGAALGATWALAPMVAGSLVLANAGASALDVGLNIQGGHAERVLGRSLLPFMHAGFSGGAILGALLGSLSAHLGIPLLPMVAGTAAIVLVVYLSALRYLGELDPALTARQTGARTARAWTEKRTLLIGLVVFSAGLTEGSATDWMALAVVDGFDQTEATGALAFGLFMTFLLASRILGTRLVDTYGRVLVLRVQAVAAAIGLSLFVFAPSLPIALVGVTLWGTGVALGFPVGMSAASDDPLRAAARISVVSTVGYTAFIVGPAVLGMLAELFGYRGALGLILLPLALSYLAAGATRRIVPGAPGH